MATKTAEDVLMKKLQFIKSEHHFKNNEKKEAMLLRTLHNYDELAEMLEIYLLARKMNKLTKEM